MAYTYTGREWDKETGLYYYRHRYYDPMEGRFISKDPISFKGGDVNLYGYVQNNPVNYKDPKGTISVPGAITVGVFTAWLAGFEHCMEIMTGTKLPRDPNTCPAPDPAKFAKAANYCFNLFNMLGAIGLGDAISSTITTIETEIGGLND